MYVYVVIKVLHSLWNLIVRPRLVTWSVPTSAGKVP